jgi:RNA recognition motif-containing protein
MSKKSDTTRPKPDLEPELKPKRLKSEPELGSEHEPKLTSETYDPISEESYEFLTPDAVYGKLNSEDSDSSDDESCRTKADVMYLDLSRKLSVSIYLINLEFPFSILIIDS